MGINECVMCPNFGYPWSRDRELRHNKTLKNAIFDLKMYLIRL